MDGTERISTAAGLEARLDAMRSTGGDLAAFDDAVSRLGAALDKPIGWRALLAIAKVGRAAYTDHPLVTAATPPVFAGRSAAQLPVGARTTRTDGPRTAPDEGESPLAYGEHLAQHLTAWLADRQRGLDEEAAEVAPVYVALLARSDFRHAIGWQRSLDAHALMVLMLERAGRELGRATPEALLEEELFRWLHLATYEDVDPRLLDEVRRRREVRLAHHTHPAAQVAVMVCETPLPHSLGYEQLDVGVGEFSLTTDQLADSFEDLAARGDVDSSEWSARARGFADTGGLDLTPANTAPELEAYAAGHLLRWLVDQDLPVGPVRLRVADHYAHEVVDTLVRAPARLDRESIPAVVAHTMAMWHIRENDGPVRFADELTLLAWLAAQTRVAILLGVWLEQRDPQAPD